jgi:ribose transport system substrate-binding protein
MKTKKWLMVVCVALAAMFLFAACSSGGGDAAADGGAAEESSSAPAEESAADTSADDTAAEESADAPASSGEGRTFVMIAKTLANSWATKLQLGANTAAEELGIELHIVAPEKESDMQKQIQYVEDYITQEVDGILLCPAGSAELVPAVKKANEAGIPIVIFDTPLDDAAVEAAGAEYITYIGTENYDAGAQGAKLCGETFPDGVEVCVIEGVPGQDTSEQRVSGFIETLEKDFPNCTVVSKQPGYWEANKGYDVAANAIQANPDLGVIWVASDLMGVGVAQLIKTDGLEDQITIIGVDGQLEAIEYTLEGIYTGTVGQSPYDMTYLGVYALNDTLDGKSVEPVIYTDMPIITKENAQEYLDQEQMYMDMAA